jgi:glycerophosphoryl diester phosphodiesterase
MRDWLTARPIAHRGLHDAAAGIVENTASAFRAAIAGDYAIECDLQLSADGEAMVYHDATLGRLTEGRDRLDKMPAAALKGAAFKGTADRMQTLGELCEQVDGRVTLVIELKSHFDGNRKLAARTAEVLAGYGGPVAVMSFDPAPIAAMRDRAPKIPRGLVAQRHDPHVNQDAASPSMSYVRQAISAHPQFLAYRVKDLPATLPLLARRVLGMPLLTWTVRTSEDRAAAARFADQMIFEGFRP